MWDFFVKNILIFRLLDLKIKQGLVRFFDYKEYFL